MDARLFVVVTKPMRNFRGDLSMAVIRSGRLEEAFLARARIETYSEGVAFVGGN